MGSSSSGSFPLVLIHCASLGGAHWHFGWTPVPFSLAFLLFWSFFFTYFRKLSWLLECLICSTRTLILLARILPLFVHNSVHCMLGDIVDSSPFALVTVVGHSFLNSAHSLAVCSITFLIDWHVSDQRSNSMFSKRPREHIAGAFPLSHCVGHFDELLEFGGASGKGFFKPSLILSYFVNYGKIHVK